MMNGRALVTTDRSVLTTTPLAVLSASEASASRSRREGPCNFDPWLRILLLPGGMISYHVPNAQDQCVSPRLLQA